MIVNPRKYSDLQKFSQIPIIYVEKLQGRSAIPFSFTIVVKNAPCVKGRAQLRPIMPSFLNANMQIEYHDLHRKDKVNTELTSRIRP